MANSFNIYSFYNTYKSYLFRALKLFYIPLICSLVIAYYFYKKEKEIPITYNTGIIYMLEEELNSASTGAATNPMLAALAGGGASSNKKLMVDLAKSNKLIETTLLKTVVVDTSIVVLANYYINNCGMRENWKENGDDKMIKFNFPVNYVVGTNKETDYLIRSISQNIISKFVSRVLESGLIVMVYTENHELFAKIFLDNHFATISEFYAAKKSKRSSEMIESSRRKKDEMLAKVRSYEGGIASIQDEGFGVVMNRARLGELNTARELKIAQSLYQESAIAYNSALIDLERNKPLISIIDDSRLPLTAIAPNPMKKAQIMFLISFIIEFALVIALFFGLDFLKEQKKEYRAIKTA
jgi:hypothetical protein